jgi:LysR family nitrogen assimilation transcriptional regulator
LDFEELKIFLAVAELGSFTKASIRLGSTQSGISRRVQRLEEELETRLLYRNGRGVTLTDAGVRVKTMAEAVFQLIDETREELGAAGNRLRGSVTLGLPPSLGASLSMPLARQFRETHPEARLRIVEAFSGTLLEWLEAAQVDVAVLYDARRSPTILTTPLLVESLYLIEAAARDPGEEFATDSDLAEGSFALSTSANGLRRVIDAAAARAGIEMDITVEMDSLAALKQVVEVGPERCILPLGAVYREVREGLLQARQFRGDHLKALLVTATPLHRPVTRLMAATMQMLLEQMRQGLSDGLIAGELLHH